MSFRKRNEPISGAGLARAPLGAPRPPPGSTPSAPSRISQPRHFPGRKASPTLEKTSDPETPNIFRNRGVRPSSVTSQPTVSTGTADLDRILVHQGLPLGHSLLVEESGTTDFSLVLLRAFAAQGVLQNRREKKITCHVVVVGPTAAWAKDLPGEYKGSSKEQKKAQLDEDSQKVNVSNVVEKDLKIAWRYGLRTMDKPAPSEDSDGALDLYSAQFDITQRLVPAPSAQEMTFVPVGTLRPGAAENVAKIVDSVAKLVSVHSKQGRLVRIVVPGLLNPSIYSYECTAATYMVPLLHGLKSILSLYPTATLMASIAVELYPRECLLTHMAEVLMDGVLHLQPFNPDMTALVERAYKNEPAKIQQGFVNIIKIPVLSDKGMMMVAHGEHAFKNGRKKFEIEDWGIPVEDEGEEVTTTQKIDF